MSGPEGYEDQYKIGARPYLERVGGDMVGPVTFQVSGATNPHIASGTGFGPLVLGKAATATYATADTDVVVGDDFEVKGAADFVGTVTGRGTVIGASQLQVGVSGARMFLGTGSVNPSQSALSLYTTGLAQSAAARYIRMYGASSSGSGNAAAAVAFFGGHNSADGDRFAPVIVGSAVNKDPSVYAGLFGNQADPVFAVFDREDPAVHTDHYMYMQRTRDSSSDPYALLASALGPTVIGDSTLNPAASPVYTNAVVMAGVFNASALQAINLGLSSGVGQDLKLRAGTGLPIGGGATAALEAGGVRVRFGVFVDDDTVVHDGYIKIKDDAGTERWLGVVKAGT